MRKTLALAALALTLDVMPAHAAAPGIEDRRALETLARQADEAWNDADAMRMGSYYADDATLMLSAMQAPLQGRAAVQNYFKRAFGRRPAGMRHVTVLTSLDLIGDSVAVNDADVRVERRNPDGSYSLVRTFKNHSVAVREGGTWKLRMVRAHALPDTVK